jgi:mono/diheme cytochrome c family protein
MALALMITGGCSSISGPTGGGDGVAFSANVQPIFDLNCVACHGASGGLDLSPALSYANLVSVESFGYSPHMLVQPGDPANSVLYGKVTGDSYGNRMPRGFGPLSDSEIEIIRLWIEEGALAN